MRRQPHFRLQLIWQSSDPLTANRQVKYYYVTLFDVTGVIVLTLSVCLCVCTLPVSRLNGQMYRLRFCQVG